MKILLWFFVTGETQTVIQSDKHPGPSVQWGEPGLGLPPGHLVFICAVECGGVGWGSLSVAQVKVHREIK